MNNFEQNSDPIEEKERRSLENEEFRDKIRDEFADKLEFIVNKNSNLPEKVRDGEKADWSTETKEILLEAASEFGLGREDMERLEDIFLRREAEDL